jgi:methylmalonyl-CoA decarboxylase
MAENVENVAADVAVLPIQTSFDDHVGVIALDNYAKRNALSGTMIAAILAALETFKSALARAVILRSAQDGPVWSSGHAIDELPEADRDPLPYDDPLEQLLRAVKNFPAPVIAMIHGSVWGGACDLVLACDLVVADESAGFAVTPAKIGVPYNIVGVLNFMNRLPNALVKEMFFTADLIDARRAERVGLINRLVAPEDLEAEAFAVARRIASRSPAAISAFKETIRALSDAAPINPDTYEYLQGLRRTVYHGPDYREGVAAFREKRAPKF